jgi:ParB/RepB/Spo0J family partition protein
MAEVNGAATRADVPIPPPQAARIAAMKAVVAIALALIDINPAQAGRNTGEGKNTLTESIRQHGVLQPLGVVKNGNRFRVIWGNRRLACAIEAGLTEVPCVVFETEMSELEFLALMWAENEHRLDWQPWEKMDHLVALKKAGMLQKDMASKLKIDAGMVSGFLKIAENGIPRLLDEFRGGLAVTTAMDIARQSPDVQHERLDLAKGGATRDEVRNGGDGSKKGNGRGKGARRSPGKRMQRATVMLTGGHQVIVISKSLDIGTVQGILSSAHEAAAKAEYHLDDWLKVMAAEARKKGGAS